MPFFLGFLFLVFSCFPALAQCLSAAEIAKYHNSSLSFYAKSVSGATKRENHASAALIGPRHVATALHVVKDSPNSLAKWTDIRLSSWSEIVSGKFPSAGTEYKARVVWSNDSIDAAILELGHELRGLPFPLASEPKVVEAGYTFGYPAKMNAGVVKIVPSTLVVLIDTVDQKVTNFARNGSSSSIEVRQLIVWPMISLKVEPYKARTGEFPTGADLAQILKEAGSVLEIFGPGSSGSPVVTCRGELIGVVSSISSDSARVFGSGSSKFLKEVRNFLGSNAGIAARDSKTPTVSREAESQWDRNNK
ncbi:MAG: serine protease [Patescibacteria group bacterium]